MKNKRKKEHSNDTIKREIGYNKKREISKIIDEIYNTSIILEIFKNDNEIEELIKKFSSCKENKSRKVSKINMEENIENINSINDPLNNSFATLEEEKRVTKIMDKLKELHFKRAKRQYAEIFYERYINNLSSEEIGKMYNITKEEVNTRILEMVRYIQDIKEHF